eukprot:CAMPEP_0118969364 /NCGR_PEP_ID=MMETSP1173-20130426/6467_1 /TAXON_ID=1034831 /ORGANISM="Rhizochromulina marina cf, Strain CCMP1243" /LENGTH=147 /DNA_ID=CAMNT_0006918595 /DNA_START=111 /DNA_END=552 /DNA_ORIENTATION=-
MKTTLFAQDSPNSFLRGCWKASRVGERLSPYMSIVCVVMASTSCSSDERHRGGGRASTGLPRVMAVSARGVLMAGVARCAHEENRPPEPAWAKGPGLERRVMPSTDQPAEAGARRGPKAIALRGLCVCRRAHLPLVLLQSSTPKPLK